MGSFGGDRVAITNKSGGFTLPANASFTSLSVTNLNGNAGVINLGLQDVGTQLQWTYTLPTGGTFTIFPPSENDPPTVNGQAGIYFNNANKLLMFSGDGITWTAVQTL